MMDLSVLNREQQEAANTLEGPLLILAGAGSGKTKTLTYRVANLIEHGVRPESIMAITFTNKAAAEMKQRITAMIGEDAEKIRISTFHSACVRMLRYDIEKLGYSRSFTIYDDEDQGKVLKEALKKLNIDEKVLSIRTLKSAIGQAKCQLLSPEEWFAQSERGFESQRIYDVYRVYEESLKKSNALDFDDLLVKTLQLFAVCPVVLQAYQERIQYIHVDEYQDTNYAQYMFVRLLSAKSRNLCVVGDDDQSIYGWRGADIRNILDFEKDYPEAKVIKLEQNYRSTSNILDAANQVIAKNESRKDKARWTSKPEGEKIGVCRLSDEKEEAEWVVDQVRRMYSLGYRPADIGILYRTHAQSRVLEERLVHAGEKYRIYGGLRFYERREIKDILAYLHLIVNQADDISLRRIINVPKRSIGDTTVSELAAYAMEQGVPLMTACIDLPAMISARAKKSVGKFTDQILMLTLQQSRMRLSEFVQMLINETGLADQYRDGTEESNARLENIEEFLGAVSEYETRNDKAELADFLANVALVSDMDGDQADEGAVTLMTLHSAKGLEFPVVFMVGMEENLFPSARSVDDPQKLEEERRLCYVGITRAKEKLFFTSACRRMLFNQIQFNDSSRFISDIPGRVLINLSPYGGNNTRERSEYRGRQEQSGLWSGGTTYTKRNDSPGLTMARPNSSSLQSWLQSRSRVAEHPESNGAAQGADAKRAMEAAAGDRVNHRKFGDGVILRVSGDETDRRILVRFDDPQIGVRQLALRLAPVTLYRGIRTGEQTLE